MSREIVSYVHHNPDRPVFVDEALKGKHRDNCLCFCCNKFHPGSIDNCEIANLLYKICIMHELVTPVYECPEWEEKLVVI